MIRRARSLAGTILADTVLAGVLAGTVLAGTVLAAPADPPAGPPVELIHLGNAGFLITAGETQILIDALYGGGLTGYGVVPAPLRQELEEAAGPFAGVDLVLATHHHGDHFDPQAVGRHLAANPGARFVSTRQAEDQLRRHFAGYREIASRVTGLWPDEGRTERLEHAGVHLDVLNLHHGRDRRPEVQNLGFVIELGGRRLLHVGDTEAGARDLRPYALADRDVDVALLPTWFFDPARLESVAARRLVAMHLSAPTAPVDYFWPSKTYAGQLERLREAAPKVWIPERAMATLELP